MHWRRKFGYELGTSLCVYMVLLVISIWIQIASEPVGVLRYLIALAPMTGCVGVLWAILRAVQHMDELERKIQFEALAFAFVGTAFLTFGWGFAEVFGAPKLPAFGIWPIMGALWCLGTVAAGRRYR